MEFATWAPLIGAVGGLLTGAIGVIAFWMTRASNEATALKTATDAYQLALSAHSKIEAHAREFATNKDLVAAETRMAASVSEIRGDIRGMNSRLDRVLEGMHKP